MSNPDDLHVERTAVEGPTVVHREVVTERPARGDSSAGWWLAALVAVVALIGLLFVFNNGAANQDQLQAARDAGRSEAMLDNASADAQTAAASAAQASQHATDSMARATEAAAENARMAAAETARATQDAAADASAAAADASTQVPDQQPER
jgi:hypothetical protein